MPIGPAVRRLFGRYEHTVASLYRAFFFDIDDYKRQLRAWALEPKRILEVGCGEGAVTEALVELYPGAQIMAIDIMPAVGRLYRAPSEAVHFRQVTVQQVASEQPGRFGLEIISDVIHHVPQEMRGALLDAVRRCLSAGGALIIKDWESRRTSIQWLLYACGGWLTGDRLSYLTPEQMRVRLASASFRSLSDDVRLRPWANNFALLAHA